MNAITQRLEQQAQAMRHRHEDVEDLLNYGASLVEIIERSGYKGWKGLRTSLQHAGRDDLLEKLRVKLVDADLPPETRKVRPKCQDNPLCANTPIDGLCLFHWRVRESRCTEPECLKPKRSAGLCEMHYCRVRRAERRGYL